MSQCDAVQHGTTYAYARFGCRCPEAIDVMRAAWRQRSRLRPRGKRRKGRRVKGFDPMAVERACGGDRHLPLSTAEMTAAVAELTRAGRSAAQIAIRLGVSPRTVVRHRARIHSPSPGVDG